MVASSCMLVGYHSRSLTYLVCWGWKRPRACGWRKFPPGTCAPMDMQASLLYPHWHPWTVGFSSSMLSIYYSHLLYPCLVDSSDHTHDHNYDDKSGDSLPIDMAVRSTSYPTIWRFPEMGVPLFIIYVNGVFHYKPSILGYPSHHPLGDFFFHEINHLAIGVPPFIEFYRHPHVDPNISKP